MYHFSSKGVRSPRCAKQKGLARWIFVTAAALMLFSCPCQARAHARLLRSEPAARADCAKPPSQLELWFSELLEDGFNAVDVFGADQPAALKQTPSKRTSFCDAKPTLDSHDRTHLLVHLKPLLPGEYVVEWRVLSRDGHSAPGRFTFKVLPAR